MAGRRPGAPPAGSLPQSPPPSAASQQLASHCVPQQKNLPACLSSFACLLCSVLLSRSPQLLSLHAPLLVCRSPAHLLLSLPAADWSYACIEYVSSLTDPRNLATASLYALLLWVGLSARPWEVLLEWAGRRPAVSALRARGSACVAVHVYVCAWLCTPSSPPIKGIECSPCCLPPACCLALWSAGAAVPCAARAALAAGGGGRPACGPFLPRFKRALLCWDFHWRTPAVLPIRQAPSWPADRQAGRR